MHVYFSKTHFRKPPSTSILLFPFSNPRFHHTPPLNRHAPRNTRPKRTSTLQLPNPDIREPTTANHKLLSRSQLWYTRLARIRKFMRVGIAGCEEGGEGSGIAFVDEGLGGLEDVYLVPLRERVS